MSGENTKLRVKLGAAEIEYEGDSQFLKDEVMPTVDKMLEMVEARAELQRPLSAVHLEPPPNGATNGSQVLSYEAPKTDTADGAANVSLASHLKANGADKNQLRRFLATSTWLHARGNKEITAPFVAKTLQENHQSRLANPADCLNKNVAKGNCEKTKNGYFVTPEGWASLKAGQ